jgi:hypothetical protein
MLELAAVSARGGRALAEPLNVPRRARLAAALALDSILSIDVTRTKGRGDGRWRGECFLSWGSDVDVNRFRLFLIRRRLSLLYHVIMDSTRPT